MDMEHLPLFCSLPGHNLCSHLWKYQHDPRAGGAGEELGKLVPSGGQINGLVQLQHSWAIISTASSVGRIPAQPVLSSADTFQQQHCRTTRFWDFRKEAIVGFAEKVSAH